MRASLLQIIKSRYNGLYILFEDRCKCYLMYTLVTRRVVYMTLPMVLTTKKKTTRHLFMYSFKI